MQSLLPGTDTLANSSDHSSHPFNDLPEKARNAFNCMGMELHYPCGKHLFMQSQRPEWVYFVCSGQVKLSVTSREGRTAILRIARGGDVVGLSAALNGSDYEMTAEVIERCRIKIVGLREFVAFLKEYPEASMEATRCILQDYQAVFNLICRLTLSGTVAGRVANLLLEWLKRFSTACSSGQNRLIVTLTRSEIAEMTGTSRESVSRIFHRFQQNRVITVKGASITVLRPEALEQLAVGSTEFLRDAAPANAHFEGWDRPSHLLTKANP